MDFSQVKLKPTETVVKNVTPETDFQKLLTFWAEDEGFEVGDDRCMKARKRYFSSNLDKVTASLGHDVILPSSSLLLSEELVKRLIGLWGSNPSVTLFSEIQDFVKKEIEKHGRVFVKLGCRSPKDVAFTCGRTLNLYEEKLAKCQAPTTKAKKLELLYRSQIDCMCVDKFCDALDLFMESTRVLFDLQLDLLDPSDLHTTVECRPWMNIALSSEYRGFVREAELCCVSQYFTDLKFEGIEGEKVLSLILAFWKQHVRDPLLKMGLTECVVDFVVLENDVVRVLEVNQFARTTGSGLFTWDEIETWKEPPIIRLVTEQPDVDSITMPPQWKELIAKE